MKADVPGLKKEDLKIKIDNDNVLTIGGERKSERSEGAKDLGNYIFERYSGNFSRSIKFSKAVDKGKISAKVEDGVLKINLPKYEQ